MARLDKWTTCPTKTPEKAKSMTKWCYQSEEKHTKHLLHLLLPHIFHGILEEAEPPVADNQSHVARKPWRVKWTLFRCTRFQSSHWQLAANGEHNQSSWSSRSVVIGLLQLLYICTVYFKDQFQSVEGKFWTDVACSPRLRSTLSPPLPSWIMAVLAELKQKSSCTNEEAKVEGGERRTPRHTEPLLSALLNVLNSSSSSSSSNNNNNNNRDHAHPQMSCAVSAFPPCLKRSFQSFGSLFIDLVAYFRLWDPKNPENQNQLCSSLSKGVVRSFLNDHHRGCAKFDCKLPLWII